MRVMFDTNVVLDLLLDRAPFADDADQSIDAIDRRHFEGRGLADAQPAGVHEGKECAVNRAFDNTQETLHLLAVPGMRESIVDGMKTPVEECAEDLDW